MLHLKKDFLKNLVTLRRPNFHLKLGNVPSTPLLKVLPAVPYSRSPVSHQKSLSCRLHSKAISLPPSYCSHDVFPLQKTWKRLPLKEIRQLWMITLDPRNEPESPASAAGQGNRNVTALPYAPNVRMRKRSAFNHLLPSKNTIGMRAQNTWQTLTDRNSGPNQALLERISVLEAQLGACATDPPSKSIDPSFSPFEKHHGLSPTASEEERRSSNIADVVGFLSLGGEAPYVGASSGFSLAASLGTMANATVWNKALASTVKQNQPKALSIADRKKNSAGPPNDELGGRILDCYFSRIHLRYPFLDRADLLERHAKRFAQKNASPTDQYGTFKIYMIYAIGATMLKLTEHYDHTPPENFFMTALQYVSAARESHSVHNIEAMTLLVLYILGHRQILGYGI